MLAPFIRDWTFTCHIQQTDMMTIIWWWWWCLPLYTQKKKSGRLPLVRSSIFISSSRCRPHFSFLHEWGRRKGDICTRQLMVLLLASSCGINPFLYEHATGGRSAGKRSRPIITPHQPMKLAFLWQISHSYTWASFSLEAGTIIHVLLDFSSIWAVTLITSKEYWGKRHQ